jgi:hypothetical protein
MTKKELQKKIKRLEKMLINQKEYYYDLGKKNGRAELAAEFRELINIGTSRDDNYAGIFT